MIGHINSLSALIFRFFSYLIIVAFGFILSVCKLQQNPTRLDATLTPPPSRCYINHFCCLFAHPCSIDRIPHKNIQPPLELLPHNARFTSCLSLVVRDMTHPVVRDMTHPVVRDMTHPVVRDMTHPVVRDMTHPVVRDMTHPVVRDMTHPVVRGMTHPVVRDMTHPVVRDMTHPVVRDMTHPVVRDMTHPVVHACQVPFDPSRVQGEG